VDAGGRAAGMVLRPSGKEPKGFVIYILDEDGELDRDYRPFYESTLGDADAILELLIG